MGFCIKIYVVPSFIRCSLQVFAGSIVSIPESFESFDYKILNALVSVIFSTNFKSRMPMDMT